MSNDDWAMQASCQLVSFCYHSIRDFDCSKAATCSSMRLYNHHEVLEHVWWMMMGNYGMCLATR